MSGTVIYFNRGTKCYIRLLTSIFSLRKHYSGSVVLLQEGDLHPTIFNVLAQMQVEVRPLPESPQSILERKASLWREMREDYAIFLDSDTIIQGGLDEFWGWIKKYGFVVTQFMNWTTTGSPLRTRIEQWTPMVPDLIQPALAYGKAINSGVQGWYKNAAILPAYEQLTQRGLAARYNRLVADEVALQLLLPKYPHYLAHYDWNTSARYGDISRAKIVHYHGRRHCVLGNKCCELWKEHYFEMRASFPEFAVDLSNSWGDRRLKSFCTDLNQRRQDVTVVTVVDPKFAPKLKRNIESWMQLPGLKQQRFLVFVNGFKKIRDRDFLKKYPNVKIVEWNYSHPSATQREFMLAAFIFGVAKHVKTAYWMKLDADCIPQRSWWEWPNYVAQSVTSHRWGYTYIKGDNDSSRHWFNRLDDLFSRERPYFERIYEPFETWISHHPKNKDKLPVRFNSFCHIEKTEFTRKIAVFLERNHSGKLPIPSQDTIVWYCAQIWSEKVALMNMKRWFKN
jgi:hypothetical protein